VALSLNLDPLWLVGNLGFPPLISDLVNFCLLRLFFLLCPGRRSSFHVCGYLFILQCHRNSIIRLALCHFLEFFLVSHFLLSPSLVASDECFLLFSVFFADDSLAVFPPLFLWILLILFRCSRDVSKLCLQSIFGTLYRVCPPSTSVLCCPWACARSFCGVLSCVVC